MLDFDSLTMIVFAIPLLIILFINFKQKKAIIEQLFLIVLYIYIVAVLAITIFPIPFQKELLLFLKGGAKGFQPSNNYIPFESIYNLTKKAPTVFFKQVFGNILLFAPLGFYLPLVCRKCSKFKHVFFTGLFFSLSIEILQAAISFVIGFRYKVFDIDDIILNTIGTILGFILLLSIRPLLAKFFNVHFLQQYNKQKKRFNG
ncbi:VanZ family protein [Fictibacillus sp. Mic-4]|uniref:VanZ family protein n=1 Tax=Fictibacillus sp. Mic-4 TaxID=3132826 RepID=UPI003CF9646B